MKTGILEDGSLSSRLKGDLYWKKQKLILSAEDTNQREKKARAHFNTKFGIEENKGGLIEKTVDFTEVCLSPAAISDYSDYIPDNYISQIYDGSLAVTVYKNGGEFAGLSITGVHSKWLEIVWVALPKDKPESVHIKDLLAYIVNTAKESGAYQGVFAELHRSSEEMILEQKLAEIGFSVVEKENNLYEFTVDEMEKPGALLEAAGKVSCVPLFFLTDKEKYDIEHRLYSDSGSVPVQFPIPWEDYKQDLSLVHFDKAKKSLGLMLISKVGDTLVIDLLYGTNPVITAALLGTAIRSAQEELPPEQKILVPIVLAATRPIVEKIAPAATREPLAEAVCRFSE